MKRKWIVGILFLLFLTGCSQSSSTDSVNILNWSSYIPDSVIRDFEKETGIKVNYGTYSSNEELLAKVSSAKEGTYDLIFPSDYMVELMRERNIIQKLNIQKLENYENINSNYLGKDYDVNNEYSLPFLAAGTVIAINTKNIKENITSYNDLLNKKYRNDIVLIDDQRIVIGMALLALGYDMNETDESKLEEAKEWLLMLKKNVKAFDSDSPKTFLIAKETNLGIIWNAEAAIAMNENKDINVVYPQEGIAISIDNFTIPKGSKNTENAYQFIDYILRPEVMKKIIEDYPYKNVNKKTEYLLDDKYKNNIAANIPDTIVNQGYLVQNIGDSIRNYDRIWAEIK